MGLDMYLDRETYVKNWDFMKPEERHEITLTKGGKPMDINVTKIKAIVEEVGYWRKANAIHKWFVDNIQEGKDDCGRYYVSKENLVELRDLCKRVLQDKDNAQTLLPPEEGFFFGGTEINQYYFDDINHTIESIEKLLAMPFIDDLSFEYHSSW